MLRNYKFCIHSQKFCKPSKHFSLPYQHSCLVFTFQHFWIRQYPYNSHIFRGIIHQLIISSHNFCSQLSHIIFELNLSLRFISRFGRFHEDITLKEGTVPLHFSRNRPENPLSIPFTSFSISLISPTLLYEWERRNNMSQILTSVDDHLFEIKMLRYLFIYCLMQTYKQLILFRKRAALFQKGSPFCLLKL